MGKQNGVNEHWELCQNLKRSLNQGNQIVYKGKILKKSLVKQIFLFQFAPNCSFWSTENYYGNKPSYLVNYNTKNVSDSSSNL